MTANAPAISIEQQARPRGWLVLALLGLGALEIALGVWLPWNSVWPQPDTYKTAQLAAHAFSGVLWLVSAALMFRQSPRSPMWILLAAIVVSDWLAWTLQYLGNIWLFDFGYTYLAVPTAVFVHALVAFPSGRIRRGLEQWLVAGVYVFAVGTATISRITDDRIWCDPFPCQRQPFFLWKFDELGDVVGKVSAAVIPVIGLAVIAVVVGHWRWAGPAQRRMLAPAVAALPFAYVINVVAYVGDNLGVQSMSDFSRTPIALALGTITPIGILVGVVRAQLGRGRVADLLVELGRGVPIGRLGDVLAKALGDPSLRLGYPAPEGNGFVDTEGRAFEPPPEGQRTVTPIEHNGAVLAVIDHDAAIDTESPGLIEAVGAAARLMLENERLAAEVRAQLEEVRASRTRIAEAADEERRKVERDLHDGAQQRLVALTMRLEQARATASDSSRLIDDTTSELRAAIDEVRRLARGMHPPILTEAGLAAAVESLAELTPFPITVRIVEQRFGPAIEAAAYFVIAESLANVGKYAGATSATVEGMAVNGRLVVTITDNGRGGADPSHGTGLRGLSDRVAAVGGTLDLVSPPGGGTRVQAEFALE